MRPCRLARLLPGGRLWSRAGCAASACTRTRWCPTGAACVTTSGGIAWTPRPAPNAGPQPSIADRPLRLPHQVMRRAPRRARPRSHPLTASRSGWVHGWPRPVSRLPALPAGTEGATPVVTACGQPCLSGTRAARGETGADGWRAVSLSGEDAPRCTTAGQKRSLLGGTPPGHPYACPARCPRQQAKVQQATGPEHADGAHDRPAMAS